MEDKKQLKDVMRYFNCSKEMARKIIKAHTINGELSRLEHLCKNDWKKEN